MAEFEKDFMLRQAKDLAKGLGAFLEKDSIDEILQLDQQDEKNKLKKLQALEEQRLTERRKTK